MSGFEDPKRDVTDEPKSVEETRPEPDAADEKRERDLIWKMDLHILPFMVLLYLFSFLDRGLSS